MNAKVKELVGFYYQLLVDHHKANDCVWTIRINYSYTDEVTFTVLHDGYVYKRIEKTFDSQHEATNYLIEQLWKAIDQEVKFVKVEYPEIWERLEGEYKELYVSESQKGFEDDKSN